MEEIRFCAGQSIDAAYAELRKHATATGKPCCGSFNDHMINSDMTLDDAYMEIVGKTKAAADEAFQKYLSDIEASKKAYLELVPALRTKYLKKFKKLLTEERYNALKTEIKGILEGTYRDHIVINMITLIKELQAGKTYDQVYRKFLNLGCSGYSARLSAYYLEKYYPEQGKGFVDYLTEHHML